MRMQVALWAVVAAVLSGAVSAQQGQVREPLPELALPWPFDYWTEEDSYARELLFDLNAGQKYLRRARELYLKGYNLVKKYEGVPDHPDPFIRDPYRVLVLENNSAAFRQDFSAAYGYFDQALTLFKRHLQWDVNLRQTEEYKDILRKTLKGMVMTAVYGQNLFLAEQHLNDYRFFFPEDEAFFVEWKIRVLSMIIAKQMKYDVGFSGEMKTDAWRAKYKEFARQRLEKEGDRIPEATRQYILDMVVPTFSLREYDTRTLNTNFGR